MVNLTSGDKSLISSTDNGNICVQRRPAGLPVRFHPRLRKLLSWDSDTMSKYPHQPLWASKSSGQEGAGVEMQTPSVAVASSYMDCCLFLLFFPSLSSMLSSLLPVTPPARLQVDPKGENPPVSTGTSPKPSARAFNQSLFST